MPNYHRKINLSELKRCGVELKSPVMWRNMFLEIFCAKYHQVKITLSSLYFLSNKFNKFSRYCVGQCVWSRGLWIFLEISQGSLGYFFYPGMILTQQYSISLRWYCIPITLANSGDPCCEWDVYFCLLVSFINIEVLVRYSRNTNISPDVWKLPFENRSIR